MNSDHPPDIRPQVKLTNPEKLYQIQDDQGNPIPYEAADGRQLFNHYRHRATNYDAVLDTTRQQQGYLSGYQQKQATAGAAEQVLEQYRDQHVKVIKDSQTKGFILKSLMQKVGVSTAQALSQALDTMSEKVKQIGNLESSQRSLQTWNDTYRVQRELVKKLLQDQGVSPDIIAKVNQIYGTRSTNKAVELAVGLLDLDQSEILKLIKSAVRYKQSITKNN